MTIHQPSSLISRIKRRLFMLYQFFINAIYGLLEKMRMTVNNKAEAELAINVPPDSTNPYVAARTEWNHMFGDLIKAKYNWQLLALGLVISNILLIIGLISVSLQSRYIPYAVQVDALGNTNFASYLQKDPKLSPLIINAFVRRYIVNSRSVIADPVAEKQSLDFAYQVTRGQAKQILNQFYHEQSPFTRAKTETVEVQVNAAMQKSDQTWQVDWTETHRTLDGAIINQSRWESLVTVTHHAIKNPEEININPMGLFVSQLSWTEQL